MVGGISGLGAAFAGCQTRSGRALLRRGGETEIVVAGKFDAYGHAGVFARSRRVGLLQRANGVQTIETI